jgi:hypothetical protein
VQTTLELHVAEPPDLDRRRERELHQQDVRTQFGWKIQRLQRQCCAEARTLRRRDRRD